MFIKRNTYNNCLTSAKSPVPIGSRRLITLWLKLNVEHIVYLVKSNPWQFTDHVYARQLGINQTVWAALNASPVDVKPSGASELTAIRLYQRFGDTFPHPAPEILVERATGYAKRLPEAVSLDRTAIDRKSLLLELPEPLMRTLYKMWQSTGQSVRFELFCRHVLVDVLRLSRHFDGFKYCIPSKIKPELHSTLAPFVLIDQYRVTNLITGLESSTYTWDELLGTLTFKSPDANATIYQLVMWWLQMLRDGVLHIGESQKWLGRFVRRRGTFKLYGGTFEPENDWYPSPSYDPLQ